MISVGHPNSIFSKCETMAALFTYAVWQEQDGQHQVFNVCLHAARASKKINFLSYHITQLPIARLLNEESSAFTKQAFILMSPHLLWRQGIDEHWIQAWVTAVSTVPHTEEICQSVADVLLHIAYNDSLQSHIPPDMWSWLRRSPPLPPVCAGRLYGKEPHVIEIVQGLGDIETLTAYLLLVWSEWEAPIPMATIKICGLIRNYFSGIRMGCYRKELLQHLDHVLGQLELGLDNQYGQRLGEDGIQWRQYQYGQLKEVLLEVDKEAIEALTCKSSRLVIPLSLLNPCTQLKDPNQCLCVQFLHFCS